MLSQFESISKYYPIDQHRSHRLSKLSEWTQIILTNKSRETAREVLNQYSMIFGEQVVKNLPENIAGYNYKLQLMSKESKYKIHQLYELQYQERYKMEEDSYENLKSSFGEHVGQQKEALGHSVDLLTMMQMQLLIKRLFDLENIALEEETLMNGNRWRFEDLVTLSKFLTDMCDVVFDFKTVKNSNYELLVNGVDCMKISSAIYQEFKIIDLKFQVCLAIFKFSGFSLTLLKFYRRLFSKKPFKPSSVKIKAS